MENYAILNNQISASSKYDNYNGARQGRLHLKTSGEHVGGWSSKTLDINQWLQVDLLTHYTKVTGVATQGRNAHHQWVTMYHLQYSDDGVNFHYYMEQGQGVSKVK